MKKKSFWVLFLSPSMSFLFVLPILFLLPPDRSMTLTILFAKIIVTDRQQQPQYHPNPKVHQYHFLEYNTLFKSKEISLNQNVQRFPSGFPPQPR